MCCKLNYVLTQKIETAVTQSAMICEEVNKATT